jgi:hypothetical protein
VRLPEKEGFGLPSLDPEPEAPARGECMGRGEREWAGRGERKKAGRGEREEKSEGEGESSRRGDEPPPLRVEVREVREGERRASTAWIAISFSSSSVSCNTS